MREAEGKLLGEYMARGFKGTAEWEKITARWQEATEEFLCITELLEVYPWFGNLVKHILRNKLIPWVVCGKSLDDVSAEDAENIGKSLPFFVTMRSDPGIALSEWLLEVSDRGAKSKKREEGSSFLLFNAVSMHGRTRREGNLVHSFHVILGKV